MERNTLLRVYFKNEVKTLVEKAEYIFEKQRQLGSILNKSEWYLSDKTLLDSNDKIIVSQALLKSFKKTIKKNTALSKIEDDYSDEFANTESFYFSQKFDKDSVVRYSIYTKDLSRYNSLILIKKYELIPQMRGFNEIKDFVGDLIELFYPITLEVIDNTIYSNDEQLNNEYLPGWMLYFDSSYTIPELPEWVKVETLPNGGHLIITTEEVFNPENNEHRERARSLLNLLQLQRNSIL